MLSEEESYINNEWTCVPLSPLDRIASKATKIQQGISKKDLLIGALIKETRIKNKNDTIFEIPLNYIIIIDYVTGDKVEFTSNDHKWVAFGKWLGMNGTITRRDVRRHLLSKLSMLDFQQVDSNPESLNELSEFKYMVNAECIINENKQTLVHLELLDNQNAIIQATAAVSSYYFHTLNNVSHQSKVFQQNFAENFGAFVRYNRLPYISSNMASTHNPDHRECVNDLILALKPLSDSINRFAQNYYESFYHNLNQLKWGSFAPRSFGIFPMITINFNIISKYHLDINDHENSLAFLVALGDFEGGELYFPDLKLVVRLRPGQVVAFSSRLLKHGNLKVTKGIRFSIVYYVHQDFFKKLPNLNEEITEIDDDIKMQDFNNQDFNNAENTNSTRKLHNTATGKQTFNKRRNSIGK